MPPGKHWNSCKKIASADMIARLALAALPLALGDYSYSYETEAPSAAPTSSMAPTRTET